MSEERKERLKELIYKQKQKEMVAEERKLYERVVEEVNELFPNSHSESEVEILSKEVSQKLIEELFREFPFCTNGIDWTSIFYKTIFSNTIDYESALAELIIKNHKVNNEDCYIIDLNFQYVIKTKLTNIINRVEEIRNWDRYIYSPKIKLVIEFPSNDIAIGWKK